MSSENNTMLRYEDIPLRRQDLLADPIAQFSLWFEQAKSQGEWDASAMTLSTVDKQYHVTSRMLLLKEFSHEGFVFFTNYHSPKADALREIANAALLFWWSTCQRQVRLTGQVTLLSPERSDDYFASRPFESQVASIVSKQSATITNRDELLSEYLAASTKLHAKLGKEGSMRRPDNWGGYLFHPDTIEFWQGRPHRLHDRFEYRKEDSNWNIFQLSP